MPYAAQDGKSFRYTSANALFIRIKLFLVKTLHNESSLNEILHNEPSEGLLTQLNNNFSDQLKGFLACSGHGVDIYSSIVTAAGRVYKSLRWQKPDRAQAMKELCNKYMKLLPVNEKAIRTRILLFDQFGQNNEAVKEVVKYFKKIPSENRMHIPSIIQHFISVLIKKGDYFWLIQQLANQEQQPKVLLESLFGHARVYKAQNMLIKLFPNVVVSPEVVVDALYNGVAHNVVAWSCPKKTALYFYYLDKEEKKRGLLPVVKNHLNVCYGLELSDSRVLKDEVREMAGAHAGPVVDRFYIDLWLLRTMIQQKQFSGLEAYLAAWSVSNLIQTGFMSPNSLAGLWTEQMNLPRNG